jgi:hypothetical protein
MHVTDYAVSGEIWDTPVTDKLQNAGNAVSASALWLLVSPIKI